MLRFLTTLFQGVAVTAGMAALAVVPVYEVLVSDTEPWSLMIVVVPLVLLGALVLGSARGFMENRG